MYNIIYIFAIIVTNRNYVKVGFVEGSLKIGDLIEMEMDLRSKEESKRTLHFFINSVQLKTFFCGVPEKVYFAV